MSAVFNFKKSEMKNGNSYDELLASRIDKEKAAAKFIQLVTNAWFDKGIELMLFHKPLLDTNTTEVLNTHHYAREIKKEAITIYDTLEIVEAISKIDIAPARIDIGRLTSEWLKENANFRNATDFVANKLGSFIGTGPSIEPRDVVLYGFGRIGRLLARELIRKEGRGNQLRLRAIVSREDSDLSLSKRASLLRIDSVHGEFPGTVVEDFENKCLIINGVPVQMIKANSPEEIDYTAYGIHNALVIDNTGAWRDRDNLARHLSSKGASKVMLTAPGKGDLPNIVYGVNHNDFDPDTVDIFSAASCTTNAITPVLKVIQDEFGVEKGHIETVHAYTNDQNLVDNMHSKYRRGRAAALNMVITETGAGSAVAKALPVLAGKLTSNAIRVPVPNGSLAILNLTVSKATTVEEVNAVMKKYALYSNLVEQIEYSEGNELVSSDIVGRPQPSIYDAPATIVSNDGKSMVLYVWYDNEYGYSCQVIRLAKYVAKVRRHTYY